MRRGERPTVAGRTAWLVAGRDLLVEWRSRVALNQVLPFAGIVMVMFGFAIDDTSLMERIAPGLIVLATMFSLLVLVQRAFAVETEDGALDALRTAGVRAVGAVLGQVGRRWRSSSPCSRPCCSALAVLLYDIEIRPSGVILLLLDLARRHLGFGDRWYALRRPRRWRSRAGDAAPVAAVAGGGASSDRSNPSGRSSARRRGDGVGRLALDGLVAVFAAVFCAGGTAGLRPAHRRTRREMSSNE